MCRIEARRLSHAQPGMPAACPARGFTLVELVLVLVVLGVLAIAAGSRFFDPGDLTGRFDADAALTALGYARKLAVASHCPVRFSITPKQGYALLRRQTCDGGGYTRPVPHPAGLACTEGCPLCDKDRSDHYADCPAAGIAGNASHLTFDALGRVQDNAPPGQAIALQVGGRELRVVRETGFAHVP